MKESVSRPSAFLLELVIDLFLFVLCAAVCIGLLLRARGMSLESRQLTCAVYLAQTVAEELRSGGASSPLPSGYTYTLVQTPEGGVDEVEITVHYGDKPVYTLNTAQLREVLSP